MDALPPAHALALRLRDEGLGLDAIAGRLEIDAEEVGPLLRVAQAKLVRLLEEQSDAPR